MTTTDPILNAATKYLGIPYGHSRTRADLSCLDCSTFTGHVLDDVHGPLRTDAWSALMVAGTNPWSAIDLVVERWGPEVTTPSVGQWHLVAGWRVLPPGTATRSAAGHSMLAYGVTSTRLAVLECQVGIGVHWRGTTRPATVLNLADAPTVTMADLRWSYPAGVRLAVL